jgi:hypothetical protein
LCFFKLSALASQVGVIHALANLHQESTEIMPGQCLTSYDERLTSLAQARYAVRLAGARVSLAVL